MAILHVDIDAFFAAAEQVLDPELAGKPVIVGGHADDRSVVASASYEARARGVRVAMPLGKAHRLCPEGVFLRGQYHEYRKMSDVFLECCRGITPSVEPISIDEAYLDLAGCERLYQIRTSALAVAEVLKDDVKRRTGLTASIGIAGNKLVAKIASDRAKPNGILEIRGGQEGPFIEFLPLGEIPGVGHQTGKVLRRYNLHVVGDLLKWSSKNLVRTFGQLGESLYEYVRGRDGSAVREPARPKSISRETTFEQDTADHEYLEAMLHYLTERACRQLRRIDLWARCVAVKLRYSDFDTVGASRRLRQPSRHDGDFYPVVRMLLKRLYTRRVQIRLVGVCLSELRDVHQRQVNFLDEAGYQRQRRLYRGLDSVRDQFGFSSVIVGPSVALMNALDRDRHGFKLRTSCLSR